MPYEPINRRRIVAALQECGPMTRHELAEHLGWPVPKVGTTISSTRWLLPGQVLRIVGYRAVTGRYARDVAVFAAQSGPDAPKPAAKPKARRKETQARYRDKHRHAIQAKARIKRAQEAGRDVAINPWLQLAPPSLRSAMTRIDAFSPQSAIK
jgi:hypothetical protein